MVTQQHDNPAADSAEAMSAPVYQRPAHLDAIQRFRNVARVALILCLVVVVLGAWVRLTDAGLGCPDWPGCYGKLLVPGGEAADAASAAFPERPLESGKAWREMIHRYAAGVLGLLVFTLAVLAVRNRKAPGQPVLLPLFLCGLIVFQALLGMWTVTLLLKPLIVMAHLMGGMTTLALLGWLAFPDRSSEPWVLSGLRFLGVLALLVTSAQIALGGWVSTNYAALACPDFPTCQTRWVPDMDFATGFKPWHGLGIDYEGGVLHNSARVAIHVAHRVGAVVTLLVVGWAVIAIRRRSGTPRLERAALFVGIALAAQISLGIAIVKLSLPLALATAHNGVAALLLLSLVNLNKVAWRAK